jgi:HD-GYP domain-containing protein (c-di-GMP phosphodiesterase class II)
MARLAAAMRGDPRFTGKPVSRPHPLVCAVRDGDRLVALTPAAAWEHARDLLRPLGARLGAGRAALILVGAATTRALEEAVRRGLAAILRADAGADEVFVAVQAAFELLEARQRAEVRGQWVNRYRYEMGELVEIARAITTEREIDKLLALILEKSRFITGADAGSIYVVEGDDADVARRSLRFKLCQNESAAFDAREFVLPVSAESMAGYVALHSRMLNIGDVYALPADAPYRFDRSFDESMGYRTKSMLCAPLQSRVGEVIGVIQLINRKRNPETRLVDWPAQLEEIIGFDERSERVLATLASLAGVALENAILYAENQRMLEGFVRASVEAIEQRDPTTSGHSLRVASMTVALAGAVERIESGTYRDVRWSADDLRELEYASLLHDFGKIGVREQVLVKAKKLYPHELAVVEHRVALALRAVDLDGLARRIELARRGAPQEDLDALDRDLAERRRRLEEAIVAVREANEPTVLAATDFARIEAVARLSYTDAGGETQPLLRPEEVASLLVPRGSLTPAEFDEIRSHVVHTFEFLSTIPWGRKFRRVAHIAGAHHERLDGTGYPNRLRASEIPLQAKMMSVSDIFDALTAADRPYKKAVPLARALDILGMEAREGHIDGELVRIFTEARSWEAAGFAPR